MKISIALPYIISGVACLGIPAASAADTAPLIYLENSGLQNDLTGTLKGKVKFAQTHTIDPYENSQKEQPRLVSLRDTLVMFIPAEKVSNISVKAVNASGQVLGTLPLKPPSELPKADDPEKNILGPKVMFSDNAWSVRLSPGWIQPGLQLTFIDEDPATNQTRNGVLYKPEIGAPNQVMLNNIRIGVLTPPGPITANKFENDTAAMANDYFQKIPVSQLIVGNYSPVYLNRVVLPDGKTYTTNSTDKGDVYNGDLRELIIKGLISIGIDNANFGLNASGGNEQKQPEIFHQVTVHQAWGKYANGIVQHGLSGGNGMATLYNTHGNEFSHELGHGYGLSHYPGGAQWYIFSPKMPWGWDTRTNQFIANFFWTKGGAVTDESGATPGFSMPPFKGIYRFNRDAMGGGEPGTSLSQFTLHTGYSEKLIQQHLESEAVVTSSSATGFLKWNESTSRMETYQSEGINKPQEYGVPVTTLVGLYDPMKTLPTEIYPALHGSYGFTYPARPPVSGECWLQVIYWNRLVEKFPLPGTRIVQGQMNKFHVNVAESKKPVSASIHCPAMDMSRLYNDWKLSHFKVDAFKKWDESSQKGTPGDIYFYEQKGYYFRLKTVNYWYFPTTQVSNDYWEYLDNETALRKQFEASLSNVDTGDAVIKEASIQPATEQPKASVVIGKISATSPRDSRDPSGLAMTYDQWKSDYFKTSHILAWDDQNHTGTPGDVYYEPKNGYYFRLKTANYWYFPTTPVSNAYWEFLTDEKTLRQKYETSLTPH